MARGPGLPPMFGAPWEREGNHDELFMVLSPKGRRRLGTMRRIVQWDPMGMVQIAGTPDEAEEYLVLSTVEGTYGLETRQEAITRLRNMLADRDIGPLVRRRISQLFEARLILLNIED